jgi:hypothetical protein
MPYVSPKDKPLAWLHGEVKTPPFGQAARWRRDIYFENYNEARTLVCPTRDP